MNNKPRIVFFSIQTDSNKNNQYKNAVERKLSKYGFKTVLGSYKGQLEDSYMVIANEDTALDEVTNIAKSFNQESILIVDENRVATLRYLNTNQDTKLGQFVSITALEAQSLENWTLDGTNYYSVI